MSHRRSGSAVARSGLEPRVQEEGDGLRNPRVAGHPAADRPFVDPETLGSLYLAQAQAAEGVTELLRRHGHSAVRKLPGTRSQGKLPKPTLDGILSGRAICPRFSARCLIIWQKRRHGTSAGRSGSCGSSRTNCEFLRRAPWGAGIASSWSWRRAAGCGSLRPGFGRPSVLGIGCFDNSSWSGELPLERWSWLALARRSCSDCSRDPYELSYDWSLRSERSNRESLREISQKPAAHDSVGKPAVR